MAYEKLRYDRILSAHRQGNGTKLQMFGGQTGSPLSDPGENDIAIYDGNGNVVSSGQTIADISSGQITVAKAGSLIGTRGRLNLIEGNNVTLTVADDSGNDEIDCTIAASGGSGGGTTLGTRAERPAAPSVSGEQYYCTDSHYHYVANSASPWSWQAYYMGVPVTEPADADFGTWVNQGSATTSEAHGGVRLYVPAQGSANWRMKVKSTPSAPYTIRMAFMATCHPSNYWQAGFVIRQSSDGKFIAYSLTNFFLSNYQKFNSPTSWNSNYTADVDIRMLSPFIWVELEDDNTNRIVRISHIGYDYWQFHSVGRTDFITPDQVGIGMDIANNVNGWMQLIHYEEL